MTTASTMIQSQNEIIEILEAAGLIDGEKATTQQLRTNILFWDSVLKTKTSSDTQAYVVWSLVSTDKKSNADDKAYERDALATIDIFTRRRPATTTIQNLISAIETQALDKDWSFEFDGPIEYEMATAIYHISFKLNKIFK